MPAAERIVKRWMVSSYGDERFYDTEADARAQASRWVADEHRDRAIVSEVVWLLTERREVESKEFREPPADGGGI